MPKLNQSNVDLVRQDKTLGVFARRPQTLKGRLSEPAVLVQDMLLKCIKLCTDPLIILDIVF